MALSDIGLSPSAVQRPASAITTTPPPSELIGCSVACLTPSASKSTPLHFNANPLLHPTQSGRWLLCCPFACLRLSANASASSCAPPFVGCCVASLGPSLLLRPSIVMFYSSFLPLEFPLVVIITVVIHLLSLVAATIFLSSPSRFDCCVIVICRPSYCLHFHHHVALCHHCLLLLPPPPIGWITLPTPQRWLVFVCPMQSLP